MEYKDPGRYIPIIYLLYSWGSRFGVPSKVPLEKQSSFLVALSARVALGWYSGTPALVCKVLQELCMPIRG